jgi:four helix bundle protein
MADKEALIKRLKNFTIDVIRLCEKLPATMTMNVFSKQVIRCSSSMGANYRAACRAKSTADFINKLKIVEEESDETVYFLELIKELDTNNKEILDKCIKEGNELVAIFVASLKTARANSVKN